MREVRHLCTDFIDTYFRKGSTWEEVSEFVIGDGEFRHDRLTDLRTIKDGHATLDSEGAFMKAFPDLIQEVKSVFIADDDESHVLVRTMASATFEGNWGDIVANGRRWEIPVDWELRLEDGKIKSAYEMASHFEINEQLQVVLFAPSFEEEEKKTSEIESIAGRGSLFGAGSASEGEAEGVSVNEAQQATPQG